MKLTSTGLLRAAVVSAAAAAGCVWGLCASSTVLAQPMFFAGPGGGGPGGRGGFEPPVSSVELGRYAALLGLSAEQQEAAQTLLDAMQGEFDTVAKETRDAMDAARAEFEESRDPTVFQEKLPKAMRSMRERRDKLEAGFMSDLKSLLSETQSAEWPAVERLRRREHTLSRGSLSGEQVDLIDLVDDLKLTSDQLSPIRPVLNQYELDLDRALIERNQAYDARARAMFGDGGGFNLDPQRMQTEEVRKLSEDARAAGIRVRDLNRKYTRQVAGLLPAELASRLEAEFKRASFPTVYRDTQASRSLAAASAFDDLTPEQRASIESMQAAYQREIAAANEKLAALIEADEAKGDNVTFSFGGSTQVVKTRQGGEPGGGEDPEAAARAERRKLDERTLESLKSVLSDGQRERLPKRAERTRGGPLGSRQGVAADEEADGPATGVVVGVVRRVGAGENGETHETTDVWVAGDGEMPEGEGGEHEVVIVNTPASGAPAPATPQTAPKPAPKPE